MASLQGDNSKSVSLGCCSLAICNTCVCRLCMVRLRSRFSSTWITWTWLISGKGRERRSGFIRYDTCRGLIANFFRRKERASQGIPPHFEDFLPHARSADAGSIVPRIWRNNRCAALPDQVRGDHVVEVSSFLGKVSVALLWEMVPISGPCGNKCSRTGWPNPYLQCCLEYLIL